MNDFLLLQTCDDAEQYQRIFREIGRWHDAYADRHGADYMLHFGRVDRDLIGLWNRWPQLLDAFDAGYRKVVYMDVDCLVVKPEVSIFHETSDDAPLSMVRLVEHDRWNDSGACIWEDGVLVANNTAETRACVEWIWAQRTRELLPHHAEDFFEQNWLFDYLAEHDICAELDGRFNCVPGATWCTESDAAIMAWHGAGLVEKWAGMCDTYERVTGRVICPQCGWVDRHDERRHDEEYHALLAYRAWLRGQQ